MGTFELSATGQDASAPGGEREGVPTFRVDPFWPEMPDNNWILSEVPGVAVDERDHVWLLQRPRLLTEEETYAATTPPKAECCAPAPPVLEFDADGRHIQGWGGPGPGYEWPENEHGITIDHTGSVWITGNGKNDHQILKFTKAGKFLLQIGRSGQSKGSNDTENFNRPAGVQVYAKTNELFVSDGYVNRRVIVFDAATGAYKRHWGAYGNRPDDRAPRTIVSEGRGPAQFNISHAIRVSNDGLVYVADRVNKRVQVFKIDGTFVSEVFVGRESRVDRGVPDGLALSPDPRQQFLYVADTANSRVWIYNRQTLQPLGHFGRRGRYAGQWMMLHGIAVDSKGNIYTGEGIVGRRAQKFIFTGLSPVSAR